MQGIHQDNYHIWKIKLELASQGSSHAIQQIKEQIRQDLIAMPEYNTCNYEKLLQNARIWLWRQDQSYGNYEVYSDFPTFILLEGSIEVKCINTEGDTELLLQKKGKGLVLLDQHALKTKFGQSNIKLITKFQITCTSKTLIIELNQIAKEEALKSPIVQITFSLRQQAIIKKHLLFLMKNVQKKVIKPNQQLENDKIYLLQGRAVLYVQLQNKGNEANNKKPCYILSCYEQGYFDVNQFTDKKVKLYLFQQSKILAFQEQFLKDEYVAAICSKRSSHIASLLKAYTQMTTTERMKIQQKLIENYKLKRAEVDRFIYGIQPAPLPQKRLKSRNDMIQTSSSIKEKCGIRIRKSKRIS